MDLTAANTAIVVDSTADFPQAPRALSELADRAAVRPLRRTRASATTSSWDLPTSTRGCVARPVVPTTSQPTPGDFHAVYEELGEYERVYSLHIAGTLSGTVESARAAALRVRRPDPTSSTRRPRPPRSRCSALAIQRRLERGTTDEEVEELVERHRRDAQLHLHARHARLPRARRAHRPRGGVGGTAAEGEADPDDPRRRGGSAQARSRQPARLRRSSSRRSSRARATGRACGSAIADADAPDRAEALRELVRRTPAAGAARARDDARRPSSAPTPGPGTVGLFWFEDD